MRVAVLDVGSNNAHLLIGDIGDGVPLPVHAVRYSLRLAERADADGRLDSASVAQLVAAVSAAVEHAEQWHVEQIFAYATAVIRDAPNRDGVLASVTAATGLRLGLLPGTVEAELTFLAARRWVGWRAGPLALLDIGGGSLEVACGRGAVPDYAVSLPLGAGRLTREMLPGDPPDAVSLKRLRKHVRRTLREVAERVRWETPLTAVATSKTFAQLARLCGAAPGRAGPFVARHLRRDDLATHLDRLATVPAAQRARLPGISRSRAAQAVAGAVVAQTSMRLLNLHEVQICPWALREGILLRHAETGTQWWPHAAGLPTDPPSSTHDRHSTVVPLSAERHQSIPPP